MGDLLLIDDIPVEIRRNKRRRSRIAVNIDPAGHVVLDAPPLTLIDDMAALVREHARWLRYRLREVQQETAHLGRMGYEENEVVLYLGEPLTLVHHSEKSVVRVDNHLCVPTGDTDATRRRVRNWYRAQADDVFLRIMASWQGLPWLEGQMPSWRHRFMKSQWGSCSARGRISLNTHLVRTPERLIEFVTLHEICHLKHHNHSRRFHALMSMHMEDWPDRSKELRRNLSLLLDE